ncbi:MAG: GNAT family N-acetyltransferase [Methylobacteriaceae bacterium]|jgi:GNAT superfamily N-acetyltransferase|nr:GNAT family N-acetyltransferase [Methylobacteriaceae bacterium]
MTVPAWHEEAIAKRHDRAGFDCGEAELNRFLAKYARQAHDSGASKTYVAVADGDGKTVYGYYTVSPAQVDFDLVPANARPPGTGRYPLGGFRLGRLAVEKSVQGCGLGGQLLILAARRCIQVSSLVGGTMLFIDAKNQRAAHWYKSYGALEIPKAPLSLVLPYSVVMRALGQTGV